MTRTRVLFLAALLASVSLTEASAQVGGPFASSLRQDEARANARQGRQLELSEIHRRIGRRYAGQPLRSEPGVYRGRPVYFIRWDEGARVRDFVVDAVTGEIMSSS